jgi:uncharacterized protein YggU (UPF0235/DUF167 family)|uniref:UPF0235 protein ENY07_00615 n=1 Tax=Acidicaldus sp. TaxID=1872105 RepID=A0A8J4H6I7_9PROT
MGFWTTTENGVRLAVKVTPRARRPGLGGKIAALGRGTTTRLRVAVTAPAEDGRANAAVCRLIAAALDLPPSAVRIDSGAGGREKLLHIAGDPATLAARLAAL